MIIMNLSGAYEPQNFYKDDNIDATVVDCRDIPGTRCYLDDEAKAELRWRMEDLPVRGVHFLDSGNYHYLSLLWLEKLTEPFALVLLDNHPDLQPPSFGEITSCGGWVREALDTLPNLQRVYMVGVRQDLLAELGLGGASESGDAKAQEQPGVEASPYASRIILDVSQLATEPLPLYISFDKDVLLTDYARTDWDQGTMSLDYALNLISNLKLSHTILGIDICGEDSTWETAPDSAEIVRINNQANARIYSMLEGE